jgi:hypothetical protein
MPAARPGRRSCMKKTFIPIIMVLAALAPSCTKAPVPVNGKVDLLAGDVLLTDGANRTPAKVGDAVRPDTMITTGAASFAQVSIGGSQVQVYENSSLVFRSLFRDRDTGAEETSINVARGTVFSRVSPLNLKRGDSFTMNSSVMVAAVRGTEFLFTIDCTSGLLVCFKGRVNLQNLETRREIELPDGRMVSVEAGENGDVVTVPDGFKFRDFEYGKNAYIKEDAGRASRKTPDKKSGQNAAGEKSTVKTVARRTDINGAGAKTTDDKGGRNTAGEKSAAKTDTRRSDAGEKAVSDRNANTNLVSKKESDTQKQDSAPGKKGTKGTATNQKGLIAVAGRTVKPGGLLDKPRVNIPAVK